MIKFLIHRPKWIVVLVGLLIFWGARDDGLREMHIWQRLEGILIDTRYAVRGESIPNGNIKLVGLDTTSFQLDTLSPEEIAASPTLQKMQQPWPWDRSVYAAILEKLMAAGVKVVMFDFVFASETEGDAEFARVLEKYKDRVVIGEMFADEQGVEIATKRLVQPNARLLPEGDASLLGLVTIWPDSDDTIRRARYETSPERELIERSSITLDPRTYDSLKQQINSGGIPDTLPHITTAAARKYRGKINVPHPDELAFINFQGPKGTYRALSVQNLFVDVLWKKPSTSFSNSIVIVGPMAEIFHDVHNTPFGDMPGPEIQAQMLGALLNGEWLTETSERTNFILAFTCMALALLICLGIPQALLKGLLLIGTTVAFLVACQLAFSYGNCVVMMMPPLFCLVATGAFGIIFEYALEQLDKRRYRNVLDRYVSKNVAKTILDDRRSFVQALKGRKQPVTILFSDIRGFTTMTESVDADKLVAQLNEYFADMVGSVLKNEGTLQKFIGDAIMAVWGDTHSHGNAADARGAVTTALQMRAALKKLNGEWTGNNDRQKLSIGIGVNHGEVIVGNVGHPQRMEFTVLGDGVNLAARLESATKQFHTDILIGEGVEKLTREQFVYRTVDLLTVKGKTKPVEVFGLLSDRSVPPPAWLERYHEAVKLYRGRNFVAASAQFDAVRKDLGGEDFLCEMYMTRCAAYEISPPPEKWDGSFVLSDK